MEMLRILDCHKFFSTKKLSSHYSEDSYLAAQHVRKQLLQGMYNRFLGLEITAQTLFLGGALSADHYSNLSSHYSKNAYLATQHVRKQLLRGMYIHYLGLEITAQALSWRGGALSAHHYSNLSIVACLRR
jgi:hypothetical protein